MTTTIDLEQFPSLAPDAKWRTDKRLRREMVEEIGPDHKIVRNFYTIGALAQALGKESVTIRRWIRLGVIPDANYQTEEIKGIPLTNGEVGLRLWTAEQIELIVLVADECKLLGRRPQALKKSNFGRILKQKWASHGWPLR